MIAITNKVRLNGAEVRLDSAYDVENETEMHAVECKGFRLEFGNFKEAARIYKSICSDLKDGREVTFRLARLEYLNGEEGKEVA